MAPPKKIVKRQQEIMIDFLEQNIEMAKGIPVSSPVTHEAMKEKWIKLTRKLNAVDGGDKKAVQGWKRYWFTWRHRCSKKAENVNKIKTMSPGDLHRFLPLDELEVRVLQLHQKQKGSIPKVEYIKQDSESDIEHEQDEETHFPVKVQIKEIKTMRPTTDYNSKINSIDPSTPPPQWALDLEDRRIAAEERMADALETIANTMRTQEERRSMLDERIADALTAIAGTLQEINSSSQHRNAMNHMPTQSDQESAMKDVIFL
ncbi:uncharacterized protein LOC112048312 [Bicyclus anynana]|uniref:Uncharacterized protein LOC112048312 n=1 Tax=Bicyclus anynana TaxID=110368 RepID=A0A6J1N982_BICAN|nr:uncharacterized protein LOC112048312 [Bicyclus anynana]XP_052747023.1 uncharacterized protein LOC112048312 [Bicyclus anynana]